MKNNSDVVVLSGKEEYIKGVKSFIKNTLYLNNICVVEANHAICNPGIIERMELEHKLGKNVVIVGGSRKVKDFMEIMSWALEYFRKERTFWAEDVGCIKYIKEIF